MKNLFEAWDPFTRQVAAAKHALILSDYDGTLTRIVQRPDQATLPEEARASLAVLAKAPFFSVGVISGRELADIKAAIGLQGIYYAGNHGLEVEGPGLSYIDPAALKNRPVLQQIVSDLQAQLGDIPGVIVEDKGLSLSVHYRMVVHYQQQRITYTIKRICTPFMRQGKVKLSPGKKVWNIMPDVDWNKGQAVAKIFEHVSTKHAKDRLLPIYMGDDVTDEDALRTTKGLGGWSVFVGQPESCSTAEYFLPSSQEVIEFLSRLTRLKAG